MSLPKIKNQQGKNVTKHVRFVYAYVYKAKNRKINDEKRGDNQKKEDSKSTTKNKTDFSLLEFDCDFEDALLILISLNKHEA